MYRASVDGVLLSVDENMVDGVDGMRVWLVDCSGEVQNENVRAAAAIEFRKKTEQEKRLRHRWICGCVWLLLFWWEERRRPTCVVKRVQAIVYSRGREAILFHTPA